MTYSLKDLDRELFDAIAAAGADAGIEKMELIAEVLSAHNEISGEDEHFARVCVAQTVEARAERAFRLIKKTEDPDADAHQPGLPGYEYLQARYIVEMEDGRHIAINVDRMTPDHLKRKYYQHWASERGHAAHKAELKRYAIDTGRYWGDDEEGDS